LCHPLGDLGVTYTVHLWLVGKRVVDFLLALIERFSPALTVEALWANIGRNCAVWKGGFTLSANFRGKGVVHQLILASEKLHSLGYHVVFCVILRLAVLIQYRRVTHTQTDRHTWWLLPAQIWLRAGKNHARVIIHPFSGTPPLGRSVWILACWVISPT